MIEIDIANAVKIQKFGTKNCTGVTKKTKKDDRYANNSAIGVQFCNFQTC